METTTRHYYVTTKRGDAIARVGRLYIRHVRSAPIARAMYREGHAMFRTVADAVAYAKGESSETFTYEPAGAHPCTAGHCA